MKKIYVSFYVTEKTLNGLARLERLQPDKKKYEILESIVNLALNHAEKHNPKQADKVEE
jgi:hypothetical protein